MIVNISSKMNYEARVVEPVINREASEYIGSNYQRLISYIIGKGITEDKAYELLQDVILSIIKDEQNGEGFNPHHFGGDMTVAAFVYGRISGYCKNKKYSNEYSEVGSSATVDKHGNKTRRSVVIVPASFDERDDSEDKDKYRLALMNASKYDNTEDIEEEMSIREQIDYCVDICEIRGIDILNVLKNISALAMMASSISSDTYMAETFTKIREIGNEHDEFREAFGQVVKFAGENALLYNKVMAEY